MLQQNQFIFIFVLFVFLAFVQVESATRAIRQHEIKQTQQLKDNLETLKGHLQDTIDKIDHNIRTRQADFETEIQTPDGEYLEAALGAQRNDLIAAAAVPQVPLPVQTLRNTKNSGLRRRR